MMRSAREKISSLIFRWLKPEMVKLAYFGSVKREHEGRLRFAFRDEAGKAYYEFIDDLAMPIMRKLYVAQAFGVFCSSISEGDITESLRAIETALHERDHKDRMKPNIAMIGMICFKLRNRATRIVRPDLLTNLAAHYFVREDEDISEVSELIHRDKVIAIKNLDIAKKLFFDKSISDLFPYFEKDKSDQFFDSIVREGNIEVLAYMELLNQYINGGK